MYNLRTEFIVSNFHNYNILKIITFRVWSVLRYFMDSLGMFKKDNLPVGNDRQYHGIDVDVLQNLKIVSMCKIDFCNFSLSFSY